MNKVLIGIITSDQSWFKMFDKYVLKNHSEDLKIINLNASKGEGPDYVDILLIDKSTGESGQDTTDLSAFTAQAGKSVYLIDQKNETYEENGIFKYMPADQLVTRILTFAKGQSTSGKVKHIVVASTSETKIGYDLSEHMGRFAWQDKTLLVSLTRSYRSMETEANYIRDPFGRFVYYASSSSGKLSGSLEALTMQLCEDLYYIPKPYPFDASLWTESVSENIIEALDNQIQYKTIVWHLGTAYSLGFQALLKRSDMFVWLGSDLNLKEDESFKSYLDLSDCRLDLKTRHFDLEEWDRSEHEHKGVYRQMLKRMKV